jgi:hypothetical protein
MARRLAAVLGGLILIAAAARPPHAQQQDEWCDFTTTERVVAVGDVHGAHTQFVAILRAAGLINNRDRWTGGRAVLIQTGDVFDRGDDSRKAIDLLRRLERDARNAGGHVMALAGNHEVMRLAGDWRYVSPGEIDAFRDAESADRRDSVREQLSAERAARARAERRTFDPAAFREEFMREIPLGLIEMRQALAPGGAYGDWLRARRAMVKVNGVLFLHGGVSDGVASLGCPAINQTVGKEIKSLPVPPEQVPSLLALSETGPLWYRGLATEPEETFAPMLESILRRMDARAVVVGHTPAIGRITPRFGGRVMQIDAGMLAGKFFPGGVPAALEMQGGAFTAVYLDRREPLGPVPPKVAPAPERPAS